MRALKRALVTGGAGFLGSRLCALLLAEGAQRVWCVVHPSAVLRDRSDRRDEAYRAFVDDLRVAATAVTGEHRLYDGAV